MTNHNMSVNSEQKSVEQQWRTLLTDRGISEWQAEEIISGLEAHPQLRRRNPGAEEARKYLGKAIRDHPFETYDEISDPEYIRRAMLEVLDEGVDGNRQGPLPLKDDNTQYTPTETASISPNEDAFGSMTVSSEPVPAFKFESGGATADDVDQLKQDLEQLTEETELTLDDIAEFVDTSYEDGHDAIVSLLVNSEVHLNALEVALEDLGIQTADSDK
ncbi:hypothetical protein PM032_14950 [Halorubrum ezzemoulense]|jgi:hypothetical protein|nr:hypothetical protein [Halorubrum ezzemoulense]MDB2272302.1 hypothetical protein [Halorubrum ezzemoulense]MDB9253985.1 hypothetical protein [Halorubrum ezzemoulense]MDB9257461.1 hypothetical protein [Halorubrum ezzemoulense]MDB9278108.1 hypothetical protein [Halorubrum ezzemoulense]MDB9302454.1 hypothetical protein [Halorubrum ezzemoulense]